ncbi:hypothetical protein SAMN05660489_04369 [Pseudomonas sp. LAMO17WK12:I10]|uniref:hypothetical protein n=1 Tax=unclassified Pseudomonas TaxID=196821 RepID=UPI000BDA372E|nr:MULTISPECIES: hypothetical protein [unclassified Pseudomonas]PXX60705.1 hypothetical protein H160_04381 [Pseudomonas sp. LAMO17WK12:I9]SNY45476.1 hypothetical protein SAMN05660489_04369 [Pseudomonas sp. LAMO17WK12:I10]
MDTNKMREQFEAWAAGHFVDIGHGCPLKRSQNGGYWFERVALAWTTWQASREDVVVELPPMPVEPEEPEFAIDDSHMDAHYAAVRMRDSCVKAIEAQGLKVKT